MGLSSEIFGFPVNNCPIGEMIVFSIKKGVKKTARNTAQGIKIKIKYTNTRSGEAS
jgi:hypothetical protein